MRAVHVIAIGLVAVAATSLAACAVALPIPSPSGLPSEPVQITPSSRPTLTTIPVGTIAATGTFSDDVGISGAVEIVRTEDGWALRLHGFSAPAGSFRDADGTGDPSIFLIAGPTDQTGCPAGFWAAQVGSTATAGDGEIPLGPDASLTDDPTYFTAVGIELPGVAECGGNFLPLAVAPITWSIGPLRPDLRPVDTGPRTGAEGSVTDGLYLPASSDAWDAVEARFGISAEDIAYLNPGGQSPLGGASGTTLHAGCTLNVALDARWHAVNCTP